MVYSPGQQGKDSSVFNPEKHVLPYSKIDYVTDGDGYGYIVWRVGTGGNVELLHIRASPQGSGADLLREMVKRLESAPPYKTVFGFTRTCNAAALEFYRRNGFSLSRVEGVYADGEAVVFSQDYDRLRLRLGVGVSP